MCSSPWLDVDRTASCSATSGENCFLNSFKFKHGGHKISNKSSNLYGFQTAPPISGSLLIRRQSFWNQGAASLRHQAKQMFHGFDLSLLLLVDICSWSRLHSAMCMESAEKLLCRTIHTSNTYLHVHCVESISTLQLLLRLESLTHAHDVNSCDIMWSNILLPHGWLRELT